MDCPFCYTALLATDITCPRCHVPVQRARAVAVNYGHVGPQPLRGAVPVPTSQGAAWDPPEATTEQLQQREFLARQPPRIAPPRSAPLAQGSYCRYCNTRLPLVPFGQMRFCPACNRFC